VYPVGQGYLTHSNLSSIPIFSFLFTTHDCLLIWVMVKVNKHASLKDKDTLSFIFR
jgi:hypothetical protein